MDTGSPPESLPYGVSGMSDDSISLYIIDSGLEYTPFISLYTTPLYFRSPSIESSS